MVGIGPLLSPPQLPPSFHDLEFHSSFTRGTEQLKWPGVGHGLDPGMVLGRPGTVHPIVSSQVKEGVISQRNMGPFLPEEKGQKQEMSVPVLVCLGVQHSPRQGVFIYR